MNYTALWKPSAESRLAAIWADAEDRDAVGSATNRIDSALGSQPSRCGESRSGYTRILIVPPLAVIYEVREADRIVHVLSVRHLPRPTDRGGGSA